MKVEANKLVVDALFRQLEPPMMPDACRRLEQLILSGSWYQPVQIWDQKIVTGYAQHDIGVRCNVIIEVEAISSPDRLMQSSKLASITYQTLSLRRSANGI